MWHPRLFSDDRVYHARNGDAYKVTHIVMTTARLLRRYGDYKDMEDVFQSDVG